MAKKPASLEAALGGHTQPVPQDTAEVVQHPATQASRPNARAAARGTSAPAARSTGSNAATVICPPTQTAAARTCRNSRTVSAVMGSMRVIVPRGGGDPRKVEA